MNYGELKSPEPLHWSLFDTTESPLEIGGWMSGGFTVNNHGNRSGNGNAPLLFNQISDTPVLNQFWLYAEKTLDTHQRRFDWGFRVDYVFGTDAQDLQAVGDEGWDFGWNTSRDYGSSIPQFYLQFGIDDFRLYAGYAFALLGFESAQAVDSFFYSHNYAFAYGVPGTNSGIVASYQLNDQLEIIGGWINGWDASWSNYLNASMLTGGLSWTLSSQTSLTYHFTCGYFGDGTAKNGAKSNQGNLYSHAIVLTHEFTDDIFYALENTFGTNTGLGNNNNQWYSLTNNLFYELSDHWAIGARLEWFCDEDGMRVDTNGSGPGSFYETTLGLNWTPISNLRIRPEVRWDWFSGQGKPFDSRNGGKSGTKTSQVTLGLDVVIIF